MAVYEVVPAGEQHIATLAAKINPADAEEIWASAHLTPIRALRQGLLVSRDARTGLADGEPVCMFGVVPPSILSNVAIPWLLGTTELPKHATGFLRRSKVYFNGLRDEYEVLVNYVDARHTAAIRWLGWLGFELAEAQPHGVEGLPFHRFEMRNV